MIIKPENYFRWINFDESVAPGYSLFRHSSGNCKLVENNDPTRYAYKSLSVRRVTYVRFRFRRWNALVSRWELRGTREKKREKKVKDRQAKRIEKIISKRFDGRGLLDETSGIDGENFHLDTAKLKMENATEAAFIKRSSLIKGSSRNERIVATPRRQPPKLTSTPRYIQWKATFPSSTRRALLPLLSLLRGALSSRKTARNLTSD